jgi:hypothetical protein
MINEAPCASSRILIEGLFPQKSAPSYVLSLHNIFTIYIHYREYFF